jgi:hypothetical protein
MGGRDHTTSGSVACPICKKEDMMMCDNYRAIILLFMTYKILTNILYVKLVPYAEEIIREYQGGFQKGRSTVDWIFTVKQMLEICWEQNIEVRHLFIDMTLYGYR